MDLQTRKLNVIEYLIGIQDDKVFSKIESTVLKMLKPKLRSMAPFSKEEIISRANKSNEDYLAGRVKNQEQLEKESENW